MWVEQAGKKCDLVAYCWSSEILPLIQLEKWVTKKTSRNLINRGNFISIWTGNQDLDSGLWRPSRKIWCFNPGGWEGGNASACGTLADLQHTLLWSLGLNPSFLYITSRPLDKFNLPSQEPQDIYSGVTGVNPDQGHPCDIHWTHPATVSAILGGNSKIQRSHGKQTQAQQKLRLFVPLRCQWNQKAKSAAHVRHESDDKTVKKSRCWSLPVFPSRTQGFNSCLSVSRLATQRTSSASWVYQKIKRAVMRTKEHCSGIHLLWDCEKIWSREKLSKERNTTQIMEQLCQDNAPNEARIQNLRPVSVRMTKFSKFLCLASSPWKIPFFNLKSGVLALGRPVSAWMWPNRHAWCWKIDKQRTFRVYWVQKSNHVYPHHTQPKFAYFHKEKKRLFDLRYRVGNRVPSPMLFEWGRNPVRVQGTLNRTACKSEADGMCGNSANCPAHDKCYRYENRREVGASASHNTNYRNQIAGLVFCFKPNEL